MSAIPLNEFKFGAPFAIEVPSEDREQHTPSPSIHMLSSKRRIQLAALVQLEFTYVTAALFFDRKPKDLQGEALVVANCLVVLLLLVMSLRSIGMVGVELRELQLPFVDDKSVVQLPVFNDEFATHL